MSRWLWLPDARRSAADFASSHQLARAPAPAAVQERQQCVSLAASAAFTNDSHTALELADSSVRTTVAAPSERRADQRAHRRLAAAAL